jgi:pimeloyl-ACP methyl ester carboxylesterase
MEDRFVTLSTVSGDFRLAYQSFGDASAPPFVLITGWFSDMTLWPRGFCEHLASYGYRVIRYDNRDSGLSTRTRVDVINPNHPPYTMSELAADAVRLLDALGIAKAHIAGFAMGGTIAHFVAIEHQERVFTLTPVATTSGAMGFPIPDPSIRTVFSQPFPADPKVLASHHKKLFAAMAGSSFDEADYNERQRESAARGASLARGDLQSVVNRTSGDRTEKLRQVKVPVLVVHAELDPLISIEAAKAHAAVFTNAKLLVLKGIGHGVLPASTWPILTEAMHQLASSAVRY